MTLFITELALGGTPRRLQALAERMDRARFEPSVLSVIPGGGVAVALQATGVPVETLAVRHKADLRASVRLWGYLRRVRPHILHAFNFHANLLAKVIGKKLARVPVVIVSEASVESAKSHLRVAVDRWTARWPDHHYVNAEAVRQVVIRREGAPADGVTVVRTGVDPVAFAPRRPDAALRARLGIAPREPVVVNVARLDKYKGQDVLLEALKRRVEQGHPFRLILVGGGPLEAMLRAKATGLGIADRVVFAGAQDDVAPFLALADCFALTSTEEGLPGSVLEAMSMATPCVSTPSGGVAEVIQDGVTGYLVPPADVKALAQKLADILDRPEGAQAVARAGRERVAREFTVDLMVRRTEAMYESLVGASRGTAPAGRTT